MANIKISELTELEQVDNDDLLVIVDTSANETKKVKARNVGTGGGGSDVVVISNTEPTNPDTKLWIDTGEVGESFTEITNEYSTSTGKGYSANYINKLHTYSTTEQIIGKWYYGNDIYNIYRKFIAYGISGDTTHDFTIPHQIANFKELINYSMHDSWKNIYPKAYGNNGSLVGWIGISSVDSTNINVSVINATLPSSVIYIVLEYIKTTY